MYVGNLPLCWPLLRLVLGSRDDSNKSPSYQYNQHDSSYRRKPPSHTLVTIGGSAWDKIDDRYERNGAVSQDPGNGSDEGSQIELVIQEPGKTVVGPYGEQTAAITAGGRRQAHAENDKIRVVTTVDVSSQ